MKKRMLRSVLATAFVVALASGAAGPLDVGWVSPTKTTHTSAQDVGWGVTAASPSDVGWGTTAASPSDVGWVVAASDTTQGDVGWSTPADADA